MDLLAAMKKAQFATLISSLPYYDVCYGLHACVMTCIYIGIRGLNSLLKTCPGRLSTISTMCRCFILDLTIPSLHRGCPQFVSLYLENGERRDDLEVVSGGY